MRNPLAAVGLAACGLLILVSLMFMATIGNAVGWAIDRMERRA